MHGKPTMSKARSGTRSCGKSFKQVAGRESVRSPRSSRDRATAIGRIARSEHAVDHETLVGKAKRPQLVDVRAASAMAPRPAA